MASDSQPQQNPGVDTNTFSKGMFKDYNDTFVGDGLYTHARNAVNNSHDGQVGVIGNEPSNLKCATIPYDVIGCIHLMDDQWFILSTDDVHSAVGIFDESECTYTPLKNKQGNIINVDCLGLKRSHLVTGVFRKRYDCERIVYWDDGLNPTRTLDVDNPPCMQTCTATGNCTTCVDTIIAGVATLDCEKTRLVSLVKHPCINIKRGTVSGTLPNGTYQACIAYTINQVKVTDYIGLTAPQGIFTHENTNSSLEITVSDIDTRFDEFELVLLTNINAQLVAKRIGYYTTGQGTIYVDNWSLEYVNVPTGSVVFRSEPIEKADAMYSVNDYLLRVGSYSKFKFNYQPLANQITANWLAVEYPADYYSKGGNNAGYLRDEQYAFFIRFVYNTGEFSESYHIPGRPPLPSDRAPIAGDDAYETYASTPSARETWQVKNTATILSSSLSTPTLDGGKIIAKGNMGYWESEEKYPDNRYDIWGALCGQKIRHHKMPDETIANNMPGIFSNSGNNLVILGVQFNNIQPPVDLNGNVISSIVGYEILRGSREGNKTIIGKGLLNNMRSYKIPNNTALEGLFQNYPYNDLNPDPYLTDKDQGYGFNGYAELDNLSKMSGYKKNIFSFHSPDTTFSNPYLSVAEVKIYQNFTGKSVGYFETPLKHPRFKQITDGIAISLGVLGLMNQLGAAGQIIDSLLSGSKIGGITFTGTEDIPTQFSFELEAPPKYPDASGPAAIPAIIIYTSSLAAWITNVAAVIAITIAMADAKTEKIFKIFLFLVPHKQYAAQYNSHGFYNVGLFNSISNNTRRGVTNAKYVSDGIQLFGTNYQINNLNRGKTVIIETNKDIQPVSTDDSRFMIGDIPNGGLGQNYTRNIASYYGALKLSMPSQYGQLEQIKQLPISTCITSIKSSTSPVLFGGDIYVNRFTEKNTMLFFTDWLMGELDDVDYNYFNYSNIPYPRTWINSFEKKASLFVNNDGGILNNPSNYRSFDAKERNSAGTYIKRGYFYLFCNGVRDFFVESEVNTAYRDWQDDIPHRHYDPYGGFTDLGMMFRSDVIRSGNYYKYDYSLSISKLAGSHITWGSTLPRDYYPNTYSTCYTYRPNRVIYSLPQQSESKQDSWRIFLNNNYKDFAANVTSIKQVNKTGALFMLKYQSPLQFMGVEELKLDGTGAKITIGDSGLFTGPKQLQSVANADESYEYGSNQGRFCSVNTIHGVFWVSQNQGKVFNYAGQGLDEISNSGMKWWFAKYLPSQLLKRFPNYPLYDNPLKGVGVQMIYDNTHQIIYITKRDYKPKNFDLSYDEDGNFYYGKLPVSLEDSTYFEKASFTVSYDPKSKAWISFHDWIPTFLIPGRSHFMSVKNNTIWKHNVRCDSYCNFYGVDYPWEVEFVSATGQTVNTIRSIEYLLEAYTYHNDCRDKFHVLDQNFDQAIIYNSEQISGILKLNIKGKSDPLGMLNYPRINTNPDYIDIQFSKEENKYRFNQFWDITKNRGEFPPGFNLPMFNTEANGYIYPINPLYVNYNKPVLERKKFRHNANKVFLRRFISGNNKFLFKISNQKLLQSPR